MSLGAIKRRLGDAAEVNDLGGAALIAAAIESDMGRLAEAPDMRDGDMVEAFNTYNDYINLAVAKPGATADMKTFWLSRHRGLVRPDAAEPVPPGQGGGTKRRHPGSQGDVHGGKKARTHRCFFCRVQTDLRGYVPLRSVLPILWVCKAGACSTRFARLVALVD